MRLYKVVAAAGDAQNPEHVKWAGSQGDAATAKRELAAEHNLGPRSSELSIEQVEVPTNKVELLAFLNEQADAAYAEAARCAAGGE